MTEFPWTRVVASLPAVTPFVAPEVTERQRGRKFRARLGANECGFGTSPRAAEAMRAAVDRAWQYCDPESAELKAALAAAFNLPADAFIVGEGIDGLFSTACRLFVEHGSAVVTSLGAYPTFAFQASACGGVLQRVPYANDREDLDGLAAKAHETQARVVYLANPDNPMGTWWDASAIARFMRALPRQTVLFLDEAYSEFAPATAVPAFDLANDRLIRFRTFSKAYGLAGCRVGYAIGAPSLMVTFHKIRNHFGVNALAQAAALAALDDGEFLRAIRSRVATAKEEIARIGRVNGLTPIPSATNFVTLDAGRDGVFARRLLDELTNRDVFVRMPGAAPLDRCIRVTAGPEAELAVFAEALPAALAASRAALA